MADIVKLILADHEEIRRLLAEVEDGLGQSDSTASRTELLQRWDSAAASLELHVAAMEEIGFPVIFDRTATVAYDNARAAQDDIREAIRESRLSPAGSRSWRLAVLAACTAAIDYINDLESGALVRFGHQGSMQTREALGRQWMAFTAASMDGDTPQDPT